MKKDIIAIFAIILIVAVLICGTDIQSVDEYYLTHADDVTEDSLTVTLSVRCDEILENYEDLDENLRSEEYVPSNGEILSETKYVLRNGDTVYDVLNRALRLNKIQAEYQGTKSGGIYVKGIHYIYEFSCGPLSGWTYKVDGEYPTCACSEYELRDGQKIEWIYSCKGENK